MKNVFSIAAATALLVSGIGISAQASGTLNSMPSFSLSDGIVTFGAPSSWSAGSQVTDFLVACTSARSATITPAPSSTLTTGCRPLYADSALSAPVTNLATAYVNPPGGVARPYDPTVEGGYIAIISIANYINPSFAVSTATQTYVDTSMSPPVVEATPYTGPIVQAPGALRPVASGARVVLEGSNLSGVSKATIGGRDASVKVNSAGELELTVPAGLAAGTYDLVITSDSGVLTVQGAIRVSGSAAVSETNESTARPSTKLKEDNTVKVHVFGVVGAGKVQIMFNGKEIAWVNTADPNDSKLLNEYLVRTLELVDGKNVIEILVDGKRVDRKAYSRG